MASSISRLGPGGYPITSADSTQVLALTGFANANAFGTVVFGLAQSIDLTGFANDNAFGTTEFAPGAVALDLTGLASSNAFGAPTFAPGPVSFQLAGVVNVNAFGGERFVQTLRPAGVASSSAFGAPTFAPGPVPFTFLGFANVSQFGTTHFAPGPVPFDLTGIASGNAFGTARIAFRFALSGFANVNHFGAPVFVPGPVDLDLTGLAAGNRFGAAHFDQRKYPFFFKFVDASETEFGPQHMIADDLTGAKGGAVILSFMSGWSEAQCPTLELKIINPGASPLSIGRKTWGWFSYRKKSGVIMPLFFGRLAAIPSKTTGPTITLQFIAQPLDFIQQKRAVAATLQHLPEYDEAFVDISRRLDPDAALDGYSAAWCVHPTTHVVSVSDVINGEDGTEVFTEDDVIHKSVDPRPEQPPLKSVLIDANVKWTQFGIGRIDMGRQVFNGTGADGIVNNWPKPLADLGAGWTVVYSSAVDTRAAFYSQTVSWSFTWQNRAERHANGDTMAISESWSGPAGTTPSNVGGVHLTEGGTRVIGDPDTGRPASASINFTGAAAYVGNVVADLVLAYEGRRERSETVRLALAAGVQAVVTDSGNAAADFAQDSELITLEGNVGEEGPFGEFRGEFAPGTAYSKYDIFTTDSGLHAYTVTRDHVSLSSFDLQATATVWAPGARLGAGENIYAGGSYYQVLISHVASGSFDPRAYDPTTRRLLYSLIDDPHAGPRLYSLLPGFRGDFRAGVNYLAGDIVVAGGRYVQTQIAHVGAASFDLYAANVDGRLIYAPMLNPAPIGDLAQASYLTTARGLLTLQHLALRARARLRFRARHLTVPFDCISFDRAAGLTLRKNATVEDSQRLGFVGGQATGKIVDIRLSGDGNTGVFRGSVKIGCAVGTGGTPEADDGDPTIWDGVVDDVQAFDGNMVVASTGDFAYGVPLEASIDDGLRFPLDRNQVVVSESFITVYDPGVIEAQLLSDGILDTSNASDSSVQQRAQQRATQLMANAGLLGFDSRYTLILRPVQTGPYAKLYEIPTSRLHIDMQVDLGA